MSNVIDFRTGKRMPGALAPPRPLVPPERTPRFVVEFFDDPEFPMRFKGVETDATFLREAARDMATAFMGLLEIAYEKDPDPAQRVRMIAYLFDDGAAFCDVYNPPTDRDEREQYDWLLSRLPAIESNLIELKERECTPSNLPTR